MPFSLPIPPGAPTMDDPGSRPTSSISAANSVFVATRSSPASWGGPSRTSARRPRDLFPGGVRSDPWSLEEVERLKQLLGTNSEERIARIFGRPAHEVRRQLEALDQACETRVLSRHEVQQLKKLYGTRRDEDLARIFGCTIAVIQSTADRHRLAKDKAFLRKLNGSTSVRMPRWSQSELDLLTRLYPDHSNLEIAPTAGSVRQGRWCPKLTTSACARTRSDCGRWDARTSAIATSPEGGCIRGRPGGPHGRAAGTCPDHRIQSAWSVQAP